MGLASTWLRRAAGATGASLIAPVAILVSAAVLFAGGVGGIGSLGQIASGPELPQSGASTPPRDRALERAEVASIAAAPPAAGPGATAIGPGPGGTPAPSGGETPSGGPTPPGSTPPPAGGPPSPGAPGGGTGGGGAAPGTPGGGGGGGSAPGNPVDEVIDTTRGVGESLPGPVAPIVDDVLNTVPEPLGGGPR